ncbi:SDR family oxidoreductase [Rapidithrix thailandica]|uniref:SDR family oxidoreductase n=1 Tax=Rapidithrix thailandica TaxID=413964 RepID=A0AAW9RY69_9BACT
MSLKNQVVIITGASSGIGEATAILLAKQGAKLVLVARRTERLKELTNQVTGLGAEAIHLSTDITQNHEVQKMVSTTIEHFGKVDVLINNAGIMPLSMVDKIHLDEWVRMVNVNITGLMYGVAAVLPSMIQQQNGHIVNVSSVAGRKLFPGGAVYCGTKFFVSAFSEGLRMELSPRHNIRITCIEPGAVTTELLNTITDEDVLNMLAGMKENFDFLEAEDIAESILYALSQPNRVNISELLITPRTQGI